MKVLATSLLILIVSLVSAGCPGHLPPNATPQMHIAVYGGDAMKAIHQIQLVTDSLLSAKVFSEDKAAKIIGMTIKAGETGQNLSRLLATYETASSSNSKELAEAINKALKELDSFVTSIVGEFSTPSLKAQIIDSLTQIIGAIASIRFAVPEPLI